MPIDPFKSLEAINVQPYELALVVPVLVDLKPASSITLIEGDEDTFEVNQKLEEIGLKTKVVLSENLPRADVIHLAKTAELLKQLTDVDFFDNYNHGLAYGYPLSAVEAAKNGELLAQNQNPKMDDLIIQFSLSQTNWKEEYQLLQKWTAAVKKHTPKIYEDFMKINWVN